MSGAGEGVVAASRRGAVVAASTDLDPAFYADHYYPRASPGRENVMLLAAQVSFWDEIGEELISLRSSESRPAREMLVLGGGGVLWDLIPAARVVQDVTYTDPSARALAHAIAWITDDRSDRWDAYGRIALACEGSSTSEEAVRARFARLRGSIRRVERYELATLARPGTVVEPAAVVSAHFLFESVAVDREQAAGLARRAVSHLADGGHLFTSMLCGARSWSPCRGRSRPAVTLSTPDLCGLLSEAGLEARKTFEIPAHGSHRHEYASILTGWWQRAVGR